MAHTWISCLASRLRVPDRLRPRISVWSKRQSPEATAPPQQALETLSPLELQKIYAPPKLGLLPTELILDIFELLPTTDAICLGLACKRMCAISNIRDLARRLDTNTTEILLGRLEGDIAGVSYCVCAEKLVRFNNYSPSKRHIEFHRHRYTPNGRLGPISMNLGYSYFYLPWCAARIFTNYQTHGPRHGLPASSLAFNHDHQYQELGVCWKEAWSAKVIDGELLMSCTNTISHQGSDPDNLRTYFKDYNEISLCLHTRMKRFQTQMQSFVETIGKNEHHYMGRCNRCESDWEISILQTGCKWMVIAKTYHVLGTCRSSNDLKWLAMTHWTKPFRAVPGNNVKVLWEECEITEEQTDGEEDLVAIIMRYYST